MNFDFSKASFKDFEKLSGLDMYERAKMHEKYVDYLRKKGFLNYRLVTTSGCGPEIELEENGYVRKGKYVSFVCNDYLGFSQHPKIKNTVRDSIEKYGVGAGASPLIGGYFDYHRDLEDKISTFLNVL